MLRQPRHAVPHNRLRALPVPYTPAGDGSFSQNVQRLGLYAEDSWRVSHHLTVNYGLRYQTTFGLFDRFGTKRRPTTMRIVTLQALQIPIVPGVPHDYRKQIAPRLGIAYSPGGSEKTVIRAGFGMYYDDLAQNGWATAFQGVNNTNATTGMCSLTGTRAIMRWSARAAYRAVPGARAI
jgi:outer membrane receptor protein involved in Fe transport